MSTRSKIGIINTDGSIDAIYCHSDGYPSHQTAILLDSYYSEERIRELINLGDISYLGHNIKPLTPEHTFDRPDPDTVIAYHRDRDEDWGDVSPRHYATKKEFLRNLYEPFAYLSKCKTQTWEYTKGSRFIPFTETITK